MQNIGTPLGLLQSAALGLLAGGAACLVTHLILFS